MDYNIDDELRAICADILGQAKSEAEWAEIESDDMFQSPRYCGGFDATEMAFCFSVMLESAECWFQVTLDEVARIAAGNLTQIRVRPAEL